MELNITCHSMCMCASFAKVCIRGMKTCKGANCVKHITIDCSKHGNMIIPEICTQWSPNLHTKTSKEIFYQHRGMHNTTQNML